MKVSIVKIGNSKGIIIPKPIRSLIGLSSDKAELSVKGNAIVISPIGKKRKNTNKMLSRRKMKAASSSKNR